ncbi:MAG TPA: GNAT family N-acetyltransferase [Firmicutes bacterium]|nr:GNAT family N-acetyltransferase [Bacillota bacterium]
MIKIITAPDTELIKRIYALYSAEIVRYTATLTRFRERLMLDCGAVVLTDETDGLLHGFAVVYRDGLLMLLVERSCRRQGVGARLLAECERLAVPCGKLMLGHGSSGRYLYCGALIQSESFPAGEPDMTDDTSRFLTSHGYSNSWIAADCLLELSGFHPRENECGDIEIRTRRDNERDEAFLLGNLVSHWGENYRDAGELIGAFLHDCKPVDGKPVDGKLVGGVILEDGCMFQSSIADCCTLGCLGVDPEYRRRGIAASLCRTLCERATTRGYKRVFIGYTGIYDWYAGLGAKVYAYYRMGEKKL